MRGGQRADALESAGISLGAGQRVRLVGSVRYPLPRLLEGRTAEIVERITFDGGPAYVVRPDGWSEDSSGSLVEPVMFPEQVRRDFSRVRP